MRWFLHARSIAGHLQELIAHGIGDARERSDYGRFACSIGTSEVAVLVDQSLEVLDGPPRRGRQFSGCLLASIGRPTDPVTNITDAAVTDAPVWATDEGRAFQFGPDHPSRDPKGVACEPEAVMNAHALFTAIAVLSTSAANAQAVDLSSPFAASEAFYSALSTLDIAAMERVWAQTDDAIYVGPRSTTVAIGWEAVRTAWEASNNSFISRSVELTESHMAMDGDIAWEVGIEVTRSRRAGEVVAADNRNLTANVYQRIDGQWLMVSHVVHRVPETPPVSAP